ncbi:lysylphosphatidylglycerol synthase transmembrane domain-containing protein [Haloterrigena alkaliphila]|uniref:Flippase-like domain-containing protein n=1 Tax=Haloterrigena alkaliphila TaxID=2816475 RepID=A0A8A2VDK9_9EURY|nr:lysylphosphatidylglycerol synthase transmembrane domain-containing protein [Haloterrigena alkaliphila]QSW99601.1 flippase-like domain-containing protein [Haloterrigena alkaliphila]
MADRHRTLWLASRSQLLRIGAGFAVAVTLLAVLAAGTGLAELRATLATARLEWLVLACCSTVCCFAAWTRGWQLVLGIADVEAPFPRLYVTYVTAMFANAVTPMGQAGGEPFIAYVLSRDTGASYEESLASVVTGDLLNLIASFSLATTSLALLVWRVDLPDSIEPLAGAVPVVALCVLVGTLVGWRYQIAFGRSLERLVAPIVRRLPVVTLEGLRERLFDLRAAFGRIADEPRLLASVLGYSYLGWVLYVLPLYFAGRAFGVAIDPLVLFIAVSASMLAGYVPSPGGLGGVEAALTGLLVALVAVSSAEAYAITLTYRVATYWLVIAGGGLAALAVLRRE